MSSRPGERDAQAKVLHAIVSSNRPLSQAEVIERTGLSAEQVRRHLQKVVRDGNVVAEGATRNRRYRKVKQQPGTFHSEVRNKTEATAAANAQKVTDAVARLGLRERVLKAIAGAGTLTADQLVEQLAAHPDDIAEACAWLTERQKVTRADDGTFHRNGMASVG